MDNIISVFESVIGVILGYGPLLLLPVMFIALGLIFRVGVRRAFRSGLTIGVSFAGLYLVLDYFIRTVGPAAENLGNRFGGAFTYLDIGWGAFAAFAFASPLAYIIIGVSILVNLFLLLIRRTKTLNLNLWDTWEAIIAALIVFGITKNTIVSIVVGVFWCMVHLWIADKFSDLGYMKFYNFPGLSSFFVGGTTVGLVGHLFGKVLDRIPKLSSAKFTPQWVQDKLGIFGEPMFLGAFLGLLIGIAAGLKWGEVLLLAVNLAAVLVLMPKMVGMVMEGMVPLTDAISEKLTSRASDRKLYIGVDVAIACGNAGVLAVTVVMIPIYLILALIIPGSKLLPLADLTAIIYLIALILPTQRGDLLRTIIVTTILSAFAVLLGGFTAPFQNMVAQASASSVASTITLTEGVKVASWLNAFMPEYAFSALWANAWNLSKNIGVAILVIAFVAWGIFLFFHYRTPKVVAKEEEVAVPGQVSL